MHIVEGLFLGGFGFLFVIFYGLFRQYKALDRKVQGLLAK